MAIYVGHSCLTKWCALFTHSLINYKERAQKSRALSWQISRSSTIINPHALRVLVWSGLDQELRKTFVQTHSIFNLHQLSCNFHVLVWPQSKCSKVWNSYKTPASQLSSTPSITYQEFLWSTLMQLVSLYDCGTMKNSQKILIQTLSFQCIFACNVYSPFPTLGSLGQD